VAVATNIDREHLNTYRSVLKIQEAFLDFLNRVPFYGAAVLGIDNLYLRDLLPELRGRKLSFGFSPEAHLRAEDVQTDGRSVTFRLVQDQQPITRVHLPVPGKHNVLNALAALCVAEVLHLDLMEASRALKTFRGVARRFEIRAEGEDWVWVDDYGHHPTEIAAVLETARAFWSGRILTVFQPHRYTRTRDLWREFGEVLGNTDELVLLPVYAAGEPPIPGVSSQLIEASLRRAHPHLPYYLAEDLEDAVRWMRERGLRHTLLLTLGAGNVWQVGERVVRS
ncbi:MAG: UDP-N-acetylmuramate--L-alanine ligase, partial [Candidatus Hydrothermae bacterium]|nr:UDP-N-acetylmuramate--L-alanine ligase [Candidatus Hydrothermae bacterium]